METMFEIINVSLKENYETSSSYTKSLKFLTGAPRPGMAEGMKFQIVLPCSLAKSSPSLISLFSTYY